jgi:acyl-coenzyme A thioesterase PaaI-like protein
MADLEHIRAIPWCARHLESPNLVAKVAACRREKPGGLDRLFAKTLNSPDTVQSFVVVHILPEKPADLIAEIKAFISLNKGVNGFAGICHGGIVATMMDEVMGQHLEVNQRSKAIPYPLLMTAYINTRFLAPIRTPSTVMVTSKIGDVERRKYKFQAVIEDETGSKLAECDALFIAVKGKI